MYFCTKTNLQKICSHVVEQRLDLFVLIFQRIIVTSRHGHAQSCCPSLAKLVFISCALRWQAAKHHTDTYLPTPSPSGVEGENQKKKKNCFKVKACGLRYRLFNRTENEGK